MLFKISFPHIFYYKAGKRNGLLAGGKFMKASKTYGQGRSKVRQRIDGKPRADVILIVLAFSLCAVIIACIVFIAFERENKALSTEQVADSICPSIVGIVQYQKVKGTVAETGEGSGIIMSADGYIITNNHVIDGACKLEVVLSNKKKFEAKAVGSDARTDLAIVRIGANGLKPARFGDSGKCRVGQQVVAIGNPSGLKLAGSVTQGIISAVNRSIDVGNGPMSLIQTDAAINPGNSGGALVNMSGQVIGINSAKIAERGFEGIGFSIPISSAVPVADSIIKYGYVKGRVKFGFNCGTLNGIVAKSNNLPAGVYIQSVDPKSDAAANGVKADDIITALNGKPITTAEMLIAERDRFKPGDAVVLTIYRRQTLGTLIVKLKLAEDKGLSEKESTGY